MPSPDDRRGAAFPWFFVTFAVGGPVVSVVVDVRVVWVLVIDVVINIALSSTSK